MPYNMAGLLNSIEHYETHAWTKCGIWESHYREIFAFSLVSSPHKISPKLSSAASFLRRLPTSVLPRDGFGQHLDHVDEQLVIRHGRYDRLGVGRHAEYEGFDGRAQRHDPGGRHVLHLQLHPIVVVMVNREIGLFNTYKDNK